MFMKSGAVSDELWEQGKKSSSSSSSSTKQCRKQMITFETPFFGSKAYVYEREKMSKKKTMSNIIGFV
jgi:hypothetical protein